MPSQPKLLTEYQSHAHLIADTFRAAFVKVRLGECTPEMTAPEESTKGGLLGLQHVILRMPGGLSHVIGTVNAGERRAELRPFEWVVRVNDERHHRPLDFDAEEYGAFVEKASSVLGAFGLSVTVSQEALAPAAPPAEPPAASSRIPFVLAGIALVLGALVAWWMSRR